jgi:di/tricarboxylate transporter
VALPLFFLAFPLDVDGVPLDPFIFFAGLSHPALIAICGLMILGHSLVLTGALEPAARRLSALVSARPGFALLAVLLGAALASGFVNDTPVVVLLIPLLIAATLRAKASPAVILMPMNYAVLIGGMATTIGTSTNLIVVSMAQQLGQPALGLFSFYPLVAAAAVPGILYLWIVAPRLLKNVAPTRVAYSQAAFNAEFRVEPESWMEGRELREITEATQGRMRILDVRSKKGKSRSRLPTMKFAAGDMILLQDTVENLKEFEAVLKATLHGTHFDAQKLQEEAKQKEKELAEEDVKSLPDTGGGEPAVVEEPVRDEEVHPELMVAQFVITPESALVGRTVRQERLAERYKLLVMGLRPVREMNARGQWGYNEIVDRPLDAGDVLLVQGHEEQMLAAQHDGIGLLLDSRHVVPRQEKAWIAIVTMATVVMLAATKMVPIALAALGGVFALLASRSISWRDVGNALSTKVIMLVAASLALGSALSITGGTAFIATKLVDLAGSTEPRYVLALLMLLMGMFTNFVSNNASAAIGTPLGIEMALKLGVAPEPYVLAVLFGCNLCYITPMGYQTNLLVMNAAGYRFSDFVKVGTPLFVIMWLGLSSMLVFTYGL